MKASSKISILTLLAFFLLCSAPSTTEPITQQWINSYNYSIEPDSKLYLEGSSNVVDFTCDCTNPSGNGQFSFRLRPEGYLFENSVLDIPVKELDCGNRPMNRDMYDALKADQHPSITIQPLRVKSLTKNALSECEEWSNLSVDLQLDIAGVSRTISMEIRGAHLGYQLYRFIGSQAIYLTDFDIDPPKALLGAIKVDNCITINMDLLVRLNPL